MPSHIPSAVLLARLTETIVAVQEELAEIVAVPSDEEVIDFYPCHSYHYLRDSFAERLKSVQLDMKKLDAEILSVEIVDRDILLLASKNTADELPACPKECLYCIRVPLSVRNGRLLRTARPRSHL